MCGLLRPLFIFFYLICAMISQVGAVYAQEHSTDNRLMSETNELEVLENGLTLYSWTWNENALELGLKDKATVGLISQDVAQIFPDAVFENSNGYLVIDRPLLIDLDDTIAALVLSGEADTIKTKKARDFLKSFTERD